MRTRKIVAVLLAVTASAVAVGAFGASAGSAATNGGPAYSGKLVFWFWAESDAPGANAWMAGRIKAYQKLHPKVTIQLVPQATSTLQGAFETAAQSKSGPIRDPVVDAPDADPRVGRTDRPGQQLRAQE